jgi:multidrug efflux system membrane fusion protein
MDQRTLKTTVDASRQRGAAVSLRGKFRVPGGLGTIVIGVAILVVAVIVWVAQPNRAAPGTFNRLAGGTNQAMPVGIAKAVSGDITLTMNALGTVTPMATVTVKPQVSGQLVKINFTEGQIVHAGDVLAQIDPKPYQAALDQVKGQLARDEAQLANAKVDLVRYQTLIMQNSIAQQVLDTQAALVRQDEAIVKTDVANVETAEINLNYSTIKSPITGRLGLRQVDLGNLVTAGQSTGIVVVTQLQPISVVFTVPEDSIGDVMAEVNGKATLATDAYDRAQNVKLATGMLSTVDNEIDPTTGTVKMRAMFDNSKGELFPNQFVNIRLFVKTLHDQIVIPSAAVQRGAQGTFVYAVNDDHTVSMRTVMLGQAQDDRIAVMSGVSPGDTVVIDGADRLREGARVMLPGEEPPAPKTQQGQGRAQGAARGQGQGGARGGGRGG